MADRTDIAAMDPVLELNLRPGSMECRGTLNARTRRPFLEGVQVVLIGKPAVVWVDISCLIVGDADGVNALRLVQSMVREAGATLSWRGLDAGRLAFAC